jgi:hypothetical protein
VRKYEPDRKDLSLIDRVAIVVAGILTIAFGYGQRLHGRWVYTTVYGQDMTSTFLMIIGGLFVLAAIFPWGRLTFLWQGQEKLRKLRKKGSTTKGPHNPPIF